MAQKIEVTISEMRSTAKKIERSAESFLKIANQVLAPAQALSQTWEGDSQVAFMDEQQKANDWYKQMMQLVNTYVANLREAAQIYESTDHDAAALIKAC